MTRTELETSIVQQIHVLPVETLEKIVIFLKSEKEKKEEKKTTSAGIALKNFIKKYESDPTDIDTSIFDSYRKSVKDRDFRWDD